MRLIECAARYIGKHGWPKEGSFHEKIREAWFIPIVYIDFIHICMKTKGNVESDRVWDNIVNAMYEDGDIDGINELHKLEEEYRKIINK